MQCHVCKGNRPCTRHHSGHLYILYYYKQTHVCTIISFFFFFLFIHIYYNCIVLCSELNREDTVVIYTHTHNNDAVCNVVVCVIILQHTHIMMTPFFSSFFTTTSVDVYLPVGICHQARTHTHIHPEHEDKHRQPRTNLEIPRHNIRICRKHLR